MSAQPFQRKTPWRSARGIDAVVQHWLDSNWVRPCLTAEKDYPGRTESTRDLPPTLAAGLRRALGSRGITQLYSHQARALELAAERRSFVVATPTASGKSLCFHLPVLQAFHDDPGSRAIYLFPTKALARDQEAALTELMVAAEMPTSVVTYDGDTPADARRAAREKSGIIITNPDMLHTGILPHHASWARTLEHLRYVVVDELHMYRGVFGSHVANVIRRLMRVAEFHGSKPMLIGATATIGNPREHAARLFGMEQQDVALIDESGAPSGSRKVFLFNPPVVNAELGIRASYVKQAVMLARDLVRAKVPTIVFGHSRNNVEMMLRYLRQSLAGPDARGKQVTGPLHKGGEVEASSIMAYRGGYLPETRRAIEKKLRAGEISCVVATNALELGIDIGSLDAVVCAGYPGSVAGMWQRFGRAGRRNSRSICVLVTSSAPLDQFLAREPEYLLGAPVEEARIDPDNVEILVQHLKCAAFEAPFKRNDSFGSLGPEETGDALQFLAKHGVVHDAGGTFHWATDAYPANDVSLRSIGWDNVVIIDVENDKTIAELDWRGAHTMLHEQAIYQHDGETWQVEKFDYENHKAFVRKVEPDYFTDAMTYTQISVIEDETPEAATTDLDERSEPRGPKHDVFLGRGGACLSVMTAGWGEVSVVEKVVGYKKIKFQTHENAGYGDVRLPEMQMHTTAFWLTIPEQECVAHPAGRAAVIDALRGIGLALETVSTLSLMCDPRDLGSSLGDVDEDDDTVGPKKARGGPRPGYSPTLFIYEHVPGGTGLAERIYEQRMILLDRARKLVSSCACASGCPACVGPAGEGRKLVAMELLSRLS